MVFQNNLLMGAAAATASSTYTVDYSCLFNSSDSAYMQRTFGSGNDELFSVSFWFKWGNLQDSTFLNAESSGSSRWRYDTASEKLQIYSVGDSSYVYGNPVFRDTTAWYHYLLVWDLSQSSGDRVKWYVNGVRITTTNSTEPTSGSTYVINTNIAHEIGAREGSSIFLDGYLSQYCFIDGAAKAATDFGEFDDNGVWRPIDITGLDYSGTNSFLLDFADSSDLGNDVSGNDNDWTTSGITASDQVTDTPTNNFATFINVGSGLTLSEGNLKITSSSTGWKVFPASLRIPDTGKWVYKVTTIGDVATTPGYAGEAGTSTGGAEYPMIKPWGVNAVAIGAMTGNFTGLYLGYGEISAENNETTDPQDGLPTLTTSDTCEVYLDNDNNTVKYYKNGTQVGDTITGLNTLNYAFHMIYYSGGSVTWDFGQHGFTPTDDTYNYISTANFPTPDVTDGTENFQTTLYAGNAENRNISQTGNSVFQPDMVWIKNRSAADPHMLIDAARGVTKEINPDAAAAQSTDMNGVSSFGDKLFIDASGETKVGDMTSNGGLAAAFDLDNDKSESACAKGTTTGYCGIDWGSGNTKTITQMITVGSNDYGYNNTGSTISITIEGSTDNFSSSVVDLGGGTGNFTDAAGASSFKLLTPTSTTAYRYHRAKVLLVGDTGSVHFAQVQFFEDNTGATRGFALGNGPTGYNDNSENFVAWQWLAGGGSGSSNTDGSINTTTTTVNTTAGISISTYVGTGANATVGHGLGAKPKFIMARNLDIGESWRVYHAGNTTAPATERLQLDHDHATVDAATAWNDTLPTTTLFSLGSGSSANQNTKNHVAYCFAEVEGFSRFSSYVGNGAALGTPVFCGFKPAWVMIKRTDSTGDWVMYDTQRSSYNEVDDQLIANTTAAETTGSEEIDFLATGFRPRTSDAAINASDGKYVYAAFAKYPFGGGSDVTPATAF